MLDGVVAEREESNGDEVVMAVVVLVVISVVVDVFTAGDVVSGALVPTFCGLTESLCWGKVDVVVGLD